MILPLCQRCSQLISWSSRFGPLRFRPLPLTRSFRHQRNNNNGNGNGHPTTPAPKDSSLPRNSPEQIMNKLSEIQISQQSDPLQVRLRTLIRPFLFTIGFSGLAFAGASIWQYEEMRSKAKSVWRQQRELIQEQMELFKESPIFGSIFREQKKAGEWREELNRLWNQLPTSEKVFISILVPNLAVFLAWRIPRLQTVMMRYFASNPGSKAQCWPMLLSSFSHHSLFHLFANMYVLHSFCGPVINILGKEQFVGLYLSAGVFSAFCSNVFKVVKGRYGFSLGASGAILTIIGLFGTLLPDARLQIMFLPMLNFTASAGIKGIMAFDTAGLIAGWQLFDHAAHLGGLMFGIWWVYFGNDQIWGKRETIMRLWHDYVRGEEGRRPPKPPPPGSV